MSEYVIGKPTKKTRKHTGCRAGIMHGRRGKRYYVKCSGSNMRRFISEEQYREATKASTLGDVATFLPEPFAKK